MDTAVAPRCDEVQWEMFGITLAGYNALASLAMALAALAGVRWGRR